jgi:hypothetical protein
MATTKDFWLFLNKLKERLIIITEYNIYNKIDLSEKDETILFDLFKIYEGNDLLNDIKTDDTMADHCVCDNDNMA